MSFLWDQIPIGRRCWCTNEGCAAWHPGPWVSSQAWCDTAGDDPSTSGLHHVRNTSQTTTRGQRARRMQPRRGDPRAGRTPYEVRVGVIESVDTDEHKVLSARQRPSTPTPMIAITRRGQYPTGFICLEYGEVLLVRTASSSGLPPPAARVLVVTDDAVTAPGSRCCPALVCRIDRDGAPSGVPVTRSVVQPSSTAGALGHRRAALGSRTEVDDQGIGWAGRSSTR